MKTKIVLDADVIIHFYKGDRLTMLPEILNEYGHIILSKVYEELNKEEKSCVSMIEQTLKTLTIVEFAPSGDELREFALLNRTRGKGESACMAYCKFHNDVIGSSNLKDIRDYCRDNDIVFLTTFDFLYFAIQRGKMSIPEAKQFIQMVKDKGSILPDYDIETYVCKALI
jgi:hypothetical protein